MIALGNFFFRYRNSLFPPAFLAMLWLPGLQLFTNPLMAVAMGAGVALLGQVIRIATIGLEYIKRGGVNQRVYATTLITGGMFGHCRNPLYLGNLLIVLGLALAFNSWTAITVALPLFGFIYAVIIAAEESYLCQKFGKDYADYCSAVPRWLPRLRGLRATLASARFRWRRVIVKEHGTLCGWICGICVIALYHLWQEDRLAVADVSTQALLSVVGATVVLWVIARVLKKRRLLVAD